VVNPPTPHTAGTPANATPSVVESHITAATATNSSESKLPIVKLMARGRQRNFQPVFVSTKLASNCHDD
jgi:hypothetical protein